MLTMSSVGRARRAWIIAQKYSKSAFRAAAEDSWASAPARYSGSCAPTIAFVQRNISFQSSRGTPSRSARTANGTGAATESTKSVSALCPSRERSSSASLAMRSISASSRRMARGVKWGAASLR
jgi:hypothetical protein